MNIQVEAGKYKESYDSFERYASYYYQKYLVNKYLTGNVLEVGVGNGFFTRDLRSDGYDITTMDIDPDLKPDIVNALPNLPLETNSFDNIVIFQVLEHLPFDQFEKCLEELRRVSRRRVVVSLPNSSWYFKFHLQFYNRGNGFRMLIPFRRLVGYEHKFDGQHYWELGRKGYPVGRILDQMSKYFDVIHVQRIFENPYHHFFVLENK